MGDEQAETLEQRIEREAGEASARYRDRGVGAGSSETSQRACWVEAVRPLVKLIADLETENNAAFKDHAAEIERLKEGADLAREVTGEDRRRYLAENRTLREERDQMQSDNARLRSAVKALAAMVTDAERTRGQS